MNRADIYFLKEGEPSTYDFDETLPPLPLPELHDTLQRYYESLKPFGSVHELNESRKTILKFEKGIGAKLHEKLRERAKLKKNWIDDWWDKYAYHMLRMPLNPYIVMAMPAKLEVINIPETPAYLLKNLARVMYHTLEFWDLARKATMKPLSSNGGKVKYSSSLYKRFFSTTRAPGVEYDYIKNYFRTVKDSTTPSHAIISGKGRIFVCECLHADGSLITPQEIHILLQRIRSTLDYEPTGDCVSVLTHDHRTAWANNYIHLQEISNENIETLKTIESSCIVVVFDENEPQNYEDISRICVNGDFHSKWGDRSSTIIAYKNGRFAWVGEKLAAGHGAAVSYGYGYVTTNCTSNFNHSAYDGTISVSYALFVQLSMHEIPEPDWTSVDFKPIVTFKELKFDLDETLRKEIKRVMLECDLRRNDVIVTYDHYDACGKELIKKWNLHPDSFVQVIMQLAYTELHNEIASTYETALMRHYYNGRTETLRSCTTEVLKFIQVAKDSKSSSSEIANAFRNAVEHHNHMMNEARKGNGIDRHLFGLWCMAYENKIDVTEFFDDPLYSKSGGGGNFILSTSTLGYSPNVGFVAPMTLDGYGVFYTITLETIYIQVTAFRGSTKTSAHKFNETFKQTFSKIKHILEDDYNCKL